jgi:hypothetical protein
MNRSLNKNVLPTVVTTQDVWDYLDSTNSQEKAVERDYEFNADVIPTFALTNFEQFAYEWNAYYVKERNTTHTFGAAGVMDQIDLYIARLKEYRNTCVEYLKKAGRTPTSTDVVVQVNNPAANAITDLKLVAVGGVLGVVGLLTFSFLVRKI